MKIFIYIPNFLAIIAGLLRGVSFEGRLFIDKKTHVLTLKLWNRKAPKYTSYNKVGVVMRAMRLLPSLKAWM